MSLSERLQAVKAPAKPKFDQWIDALPDTDRAALITALEDGTISNQAIADAVRPEGYPAGKDTIADWRKRHGIAR
jgi:hypothetical protein